MEYSKVPVIIQSYAKAQSYTKTTRKPSEPKDTRRAHRHSSVADTVSSTSEELSGLKINDDGTFTLYGKVYLLKALVLEEIYLVKLPKFFGMCAGIRRCIDKLRHMKQPRKRTG